MSKARVVIVEDAGLVAMAIQECLEKMGYGVPAVVATGEDAVRAAAQHEPDLVLMDIRLKGEMDGIQAAELIKNKHRIPVVYLTAYSDAKTLERAKLTEPFGYVLKPFEEEALQTAVEVALYKSQMDRQVRETKEELSAILGCLGEGVVVADLKGHISYVNPTATEILGYSSTEAARLSLAQVFRLVDRATGEEVSLPVTEPVLEGRAVSQEDRLLATAKHGYVPVDLNAAPIRNDAGNTTGIVVAFRDITHRKKTQQIIMHELETASAAQARLLPKADARTIGQYRFGWIFRASTFGAGDFFNYSRLADEHLGFYTVDVVGHGVSASVLARLVYRFLTPGIDQSGLFRSAGARAVTPVELIQRLNEEFYQEDETEFFSLAYGTVDTRTGLTKIACAGHPRPLWLRNGEGVADIPTRGPAIGVSPDADVTEHEFTLQPGDKLALYSDGLVDCTNPRLEPFSPKRLSIQLQHLSDKPAPELAHAVDKTVSEWRATNQFDDDISMLVVERTP
jgi:PAS domain S-box-containing protein